jgi:hypothetical protein
VAKSSSTAADNQEKLINLQAQQLAAQVANWAAQLEFQKQRFSLLELPEWQNRAQLDVDKFAWQKAQDAWENAFKEASLTGMYQGQPTLEWLTQQAQLTGVFNGQETIQGKLTNAQIAQMNSQMKLANDQFLANTTGYINGVPTFDREKWQASQAVLGWQFLSTLSGPQNAFKQARAIANMPGGLSQMMDAWAGTNMVPGTSRVGTGGPASLADMRLGMGGISGATSPANTYPYTPPAGTGPTAPPPPVGPVPGLPPSGPVFGVPPVYTPTSPVSIDPTTGQPVGTPGVPSHVPEPVSFQPGPAVTPVIDPVTGQPVGTPGVPSHVPEPVPVQSGPPVQVAEGSGSYVQQSSGHGTDVMPYSDAGVWPRSSAQEGVVANQVQAAAAATLPYTLPAPVAPVVNNIPQQMMGWAQNNNGPGEWTYYTGGVSTTDPSTAYSYPVTDADFRIPTPPTVSPLNPVSSLPYTYSGPGVQAPVDAWNYSPTQAGGVQVYPPGVTSPAHTPDISTLGPISPSTAAQIHGGQYQYGGVPYAGSGTTTMSSPLGATPLPNQINARNFSNLYGYQKDLGWANYEDLGWDPALAKEAFQKSLPRYGGPSSGRIAF